VALVAFALLAAPAGGDTPPRKSETPTIGVVPQRSFDDSETQAMNDAGIASVRVWLPWAQVESERGQLDWRSFDQTVADNAEGGLTTLPFLFGSPAWAAADDGQLCEGADCISYAPRSAPTRSAFAAFAGAAVRRYGPGGRFWDLHPGLRARPVEIWQIWNEPNLSSFYRPAVDPIGYASVVQAAAAAIHGQDPHAEVLLAGLTGTETNEKRMSSAAFLAQLYSVPGIASSFDGIAVHPYNRQVRGTIDQVETARSVANAHSDHPDLWITEIGWTSGGKRRWGLVKSPSGQARMLTTAFEQLIDNADRLDLRGVYWYAWRDTDRDQSVCGWCPWAGLLDRVGRKKPAYWALRSVAAP
jgi:polysaccharide biosynthesis protein PslG